MDTLIPTAVLAAAIGASDAVVSACSAEPIATGTGAATDAIMRLVGRARAGSQEHDFALVRKEFRPLATGRHAAGAADPRHWAYWRREPLAYASGVLPAGPGLVAPRCYGVVDNVVYLQDIAGARESPRVAARRLGEWQGTTLIPDLPWLAGHQLVQRLAVSELDWSAVGADLAHLALSTLEDFVADYLVGLAGRFDPELVRVGYAATLALTGASRVHWMLSRGVPVPPGYIDFVVDQAG